MTPTSLSPSISTSISRPLRLPSIHAHHAIAANHNRRVNWRPILLGPMFKAVGPTTRWACPEGAVA